MAENVDMNQSNKALWVTLAIAAIFVIGLVTNGFGLFSSGTPTGGVIATGEIPLAIENSPVIGDTNAPVTIYEFSDFSCPYCAAAAGQNQQVIEALQSKYIGWEAPMPKIIEDYVHTGKAKIVFKYTPGHGTGIAAHIVSLAMAEQGLFEEFHEAAFANQADTGSITKMKELASSLGADMEKLESDIARNNYALQLEDEEAMANSNGIGGTPTFVVNGKVVSGAQSYDVFKSLIESELSKLG